MRGWGTSERRCPGAFKHIWCQEAAAAVARHATGVHGVVVWRARHDVWDLQTGNVALFNGLALGSARRSLLWWSLIDEERKAGCVVRLHWGVRRGGGGHMWGRGINGYSHCTAKGREIGVACCKLIIKHASQWFLARHRESVTLSQRTCALRY